MALASFSSVVSGNLIMDLEIENMKSITRSQTLKTELSLISNLLPTVRRVHLLPVNLLWMINGHHK
jgi:hypothetical protein